MSGAKHTPGPWSVTTVEPKEDGKTVTRVTGMTRDQRQYTEYVIRCARKTNVQAGEADAQLIAAAPELLAACEAAALVVERDQSEGATLNMLLAAIRKAKGLA